MKVFISGGCKNGKSSYAQTLARQSGKPLYYLATMIPTDDEDLQRIEKHRQDREGWNFETIEISRNILAATDSCQQSGSFLLDSVTALLANEMFGKDGSVVPNAAQKVADELTALAERVEHIVFVSDDIHSDACLYDAVTEEYRKGLAFVGRQLVGVCDSVLEMSAGNIIIHKQ
jgi:adenosylcobinamide kinase/adenosylcobinamide-phosphate guanylyltransferase